AAIRRFAERIGVSRRDSIVDVGLLEHALRDCGAKIAVVLTSFYEKVRSLRSRVGLQIIIATNIKEFLPKITRLLFTLFIEKKQGHRVNIDSGDLWLRDLLEERTELPPPELPIQPDDPALLLFTGGTTGSPKAAVGSHHAIFITGTQVRAWFASVLKGWDDVVMLAVPLFHVYGNVGVMSTGLIGGNPLALVPNPRDLDDLIDTHIDYLKNTYPELDEKRDDVKTILKLESQRYEDSKVHMKKKADKIKEKGTPTVDDLITFYESDGITPEYLKEVDAISEIPSSFYSKLSDLHQSDKKKAIVELPLEGLPETEVLFYQDDPMDFDAKVLKVFDEMVVLDRTSFYARGGGQEPDHGSIAGFPVIDVDKHANIIVHKLKGGVPKEGDNVSCKVDSMRRSNITKNHTSTHILNASSRGVLGSWVWQHSAFKEDDHARLDITHHSSLTESQVKQIEDAANNMVKQNYPVNIEYFDRGTAEQKYGFRIYQGGVVPVKAVRIVSIEDKDIEACGGTHVKKTGEIELIKITKTKRIQDGVTGEIELIKITKTKRIQDGVVRLEFVSGPTAFEYVKEQQAEDEKQKELEANKEKIEKQRDENKQKAREKIPVLIEKILAGESVESEGIFVKDKLCFTASPDYDDFFHQNFGKKLVAKDSKAAFCGIFEAGPTIRVMVYAGSDSGINSGEIAKEVAAILGGSGGGDAKFAQGGGKDTSKKDEAIAQAKSMVLGG
ncbi:MAG: alanine--tRNA ligase-related protein, partial [Nitrosopumilaceae archaeon]